MAALSLNENDEEKCSLYYQKDTRDERINLMFDTKDFADVTFVLRQNDADPYYIPAHRLILGKKSPTFFQMFYGPEPNDRDEIEIHNVEPEDFKFILRYIYGKTVEIRSIRQAKKILKLTETYKMPMLAKYCDNYMNSPLDTSNALIVFQESVLNQVPELIVKSLLLVINEADKTIEETRLEEVLPSTIKFFLEVHEKHGINIQSEVKLLESLLKWAKCYIQLQEISVEPNNLRKIMEPLFPYIRFLSIPPKTLSTVAVDFLTKEEIDAILKNIAIPNSALLPSWCNRGMSSRSKLSEFEKLICITSVFRELQTVLISHKVYSRHISLQVNCPSIKFRANVKIFLTGFELNSCIHCEKYHLKETMELIKGELLVKVGEKMKRRIKLTSLNKYIILDQDIFLNLEPPIFVNVGESFQLLIELDKDSPVIYSCKTKVFESNTDLRVVGDIGNNGNFKSGVTSWCLFHNIFYVSLKI